MAPVEMNPLEEAENDLNPMPTGLEESNGRDYIGEAENDNTTDEKSKDIDETEESS